MESTFRRGSWIVTAPLTAAAVAYFSFVFLPTHRATAEARRQIRQKQDYLVRSGSAAAALRAVEEQLERTRAYNAAWQQRAPAEKKLSALYGKIYALADAAGAKLTQFDPEPLVRYDTICEAPVKIGCVGSFAQIGELLANLERLPVSIWIKDLRLGKAAPERQNLTCEITLAIFTRNSEDSDYVEQTR